MKIIHACMSAWKHVWMYVQYQKIKKVWKDRYPNVFFRKMCVRMIFPQSLFFKFAYITYIIFLKRIGCIRLGENEQVSECFQECGRWVGENVGTRSSAINPLSLAQIRGPSTHFPAQPLLGVCWRRKGLKWACPFANGYKKQVELGFCEPLPTLTYAERFFCMLLLKMPLKWVEAHMSQEPKMWLGRLAQALLL